MFIRALKSIAPGSLFALSLFILLAAAPAPAQAARSVVFRVPFEFTAGGVRLPAGEYTIRRASQAGSAYFVQSRDGRAAAAVSAESPLRAKGKASPLQLTFDVYEGQFFLAEVWAAGDGTGAELSRPRAIRQVAKSAADARRVSVVAHTN